MLIDGEETDVEKMSSKELAKYLNVINCLDCTQKTEVFTECLQRLMADLIYKEDQDN